MYIIKKGKPMKTMILLLVMLISGYSSDTTAKNDKDKEAIKKIITTMFDAMRENDAEKLKSVLADEVDSYSIFVNRQTNKPVRSKGDIKKFIEAVGQPKEKNEWDEKIFSWDINVDGNMATAWTDYSFYHKGKRSHCGVNTFTLFNDGESWKIYAISDTRRRSNCKEDE
jgi:ketosteroid isomerase-like protein